jgi:hypothetical protein
MSWLMRHEINVPDTTWGNVQYWLWLAFEPIRTHFRPRRVPTKRAK